MSARAASPQVGYGDAVDALAGRVAAAVRGGEDPAVLAGYLREAADPVPALAAVRVLGPDVFAAGLFEGVPVSAGDAEVVAEAVRVFPCPPDAPPALAWADWATTRLLGRLGDGRWPRMPAGATPDGASGGGCGMALDYPGRGWRDVSVRLAQLSPLALPGLDGPVHDMVREHVRAVERGAVRAVLRRDHPSAARLARWLAWADQHAIAVGLDLAALLRHIALFGAAGGRTALHIAVGQRLLDRAGAVTAPARTSPAGHRATPPGIGVRPAGPEVSRAAHRVATRALSWLHRNREWGALPADATAELADPDRVYKPLGETALAASLMLREGVAGAGDVAAAGDLLDFAWAQLRDGGLLYQRQLRHMLATDPLELYAQFVRAGYHHDRLHTLIGYLSGLDSVRHAEQLPTRRLAVANAARQIGIDWGTDWAALAEATWLAGTPQPWAIDWSTAYHLTHTVFHLTDWGARPDGLPPRTQEYLATWLPVWLDVWQEAHEWDLVAELLIVGACLTEPHCDPADWELLASIQRDDGRVPRNGSDNDDADPARRFRNHHHTTVVAVIAGTLTLSRTLGTVPAAA